MVVSGCGYKRPVMIPGGRVWTWPCIQKLQRISLNTMTLRIRSDVYTLMGVEISCIGVAQIKIESRNDRMLANACQHFLGKKDLEIRNIALETMEGHQRAIMGTMTVEQIYTDRKELSKQVFEVASTDMINMGITVVSYTLKDIRDKNGYLQALGMGRTAEVKRDARIGEATAEMKAVQTTTTTTNQISSRIPMPPTVARPLTSRTQILRSKRIVQTTNPIRAPPKPHFRTDSNYVVNSNNQVNIHIGSVELSPNTELNRTPTENDITWLWDRVRTVLESQKPSKRPRSSTVIPKSSSRPQFAKSRPHSAHVNSSTAAFVLAEQLASRGVADQRIMNVIQPTPPPPPQTTLSLEEQQIEQSLQRLDDRLLHIQETVGYNGIAFRNRH